MNENEDSMELLEWDKKNIVRFAQFLYDLAKERVQVDRAIVTEEAAIEPEILEEISAIEAEIVEEILEEPEAEIVEEILEEPEAEIVEEVLEEPEAEIVEEVLEEPEAEIVEEVLEEPEEEKVHLERELQEVTIGLAKAVSGEEVGEIDDSDQTEIQEIIEKEQIPLPSESKGIVVESTLEESKGISDITETVAQIEPTALTEEQISELESVDLSSPIVKEPIINEEILIQPENIPKDIHNLVFVEETTSVPITKDEIIVTSTDAITEDVAEVITEDVAEVITEDVAEVITEDVAEVITEDVAEVITEDVAEVITEDVAESVMIDEPSEPMVEKIDLDTVTHISTAEEVALEPEATIEVISPDQEVVPEPTTEVSEEVEGLDSEATQRRQTIIEQMLSDTKKREEQEGFKVRELGETAGRSYSAVVFGNESNKNVKKWKKWEKRRVRQKKKKK